MALSNQPPMGPQGPAQQSGPVGGVRASVTAGAEPGPRKPDKKDDLRLLLNSRHPLITIETAEEERVEQLLQEVAAELSVAFYVWSVTTGLTRQGGQPLYNSDPPDMALTNIAKMKGDALFLPKDFARAGSLGNAKSYGVPI